VRILIDEPPAATMRVGLSAVVIIER
jgi:hypothetical protein